MEMLNLEKPKPKIYFPEVRAIIESDPTGFLKKREKDLAGKGDKKETLHHSQRMTNLGYLLAKRRNFSEEGIKHFIETCLLHDIGKVELPLRYLTKPFGRFKLKDLKVVEKHAMRGHMYLKQEDRSPRVYNPVLLHHEFQGRPYPDTNARMLRLLHDVEDVDIDNARLLAMLDVFDTRVFGRPYVKVEPLPLAQAEEELKKQFNQPEDEEIIVFLMSQYETIKELSGS